MQLLTLNSYGFMHSETSWFNIGVATVKNWHPPLLPFHKEAWQCWQGKQLGDTLDDNGDQLGSSNFALQPSQVGARVVEEGGKTDMWIPVGIRMCAIPS